MPATATSAAAIASAGGWSKTRGATIARLRSVATLSQPAYKPTATRTAACRATATPTHAAAVLAPNTPVETRGASGKAKVHAVAKTRDAKTLTALRAVCMYGATATREGKMMSQMPKALGWGCSVGGVVPKLVMAALATHAAPTANPTAVRSKSNDITRSSVCVYQSRATRSFDTYQRKKKKAMASRYEEATMHVLVSENEFRTLQESQRRQAQDISFLQGQIDTANRTMNAISEAVEGMSRSMERMNQHMMQNFDQLNDRDRVRRGHDKVRRYVRHKKLTKAKMLQLAARLEIRGLRPSWTKDALIDALCEQYEVLERHLPDFRNI